MKNLISHQNMKNPTAHVATICSDNTGYIEFLVRSHCSPQHHNWCQPWYCETSLFTLQVCKLLLFCPKCSQSLPRPPTLPFKIQYPQSDGVKGPPPKFPLGKKLHPIPQLSQLLLPMGIPRSFVHQFHKKFLLFLSYEDLWNTQDIFIVYHIEVSTHPGPYEIF